MMNSIRNRLQAVEENRKRISVPDMVFISYDEKDRKSVV